MTLSLNSQTWFFGANLARKGKSDLQQKNTHKKNGNQHSTLHIRISLGTNIQLKLTILIFWTKFAQKGYIQLNTEKANLTIKFYRFESLHVPNFSLNWQCWFFGPNLPKNVISGQKKKKSEHHQWILHTRISQGTKFYFKQFWFFGTNLTKKGISGRKRKSQHHYWILQRYLDRFTRTIDSNQFRNQILA